MRSGVISKGLLFLLLGILLGTHPAWADLRYEQTTTNEYVVGQGRKVSEVTHQTVYVQGKKVRIEDQESGKVLLVRFDREVLYHFNKKQPTYTEKEFQALTSQNQLAQTEKMAPQQRNVGMNAARGQLNKMGEGLSPERRGFMEQMMMQQQSRMMGGKSDAEKGKDSGEVVVKETNKTQKINGFLCRRIKVVRGKKKIIDAWVTTQTGPTNYFTEIIKTLGLFEPEVLGAVKKLTGFPIKQKYRVQTGEFKNAIQTVEVVKVEEKALSRDLFELPEGYKKAKAPASDSFADEAEAESF